MASDLTPRPTLVAANVALRAPGEGDVYDRQSIGRHADIERMYGASAPTTAEMPHADAQAWVRMVASTPLAWVIEHDGRCIGSARLHSVNDQDRRAAIAVGIEDPALLGRGLGTEVVRLLLAHAFDELMLHRVSARVVTFTTRAIRCYEKCGFRVEGRERESAFIDGVFHDDVILDVLAAEHIR